VAEIERRHFLAAAGAMLAAPFARAQAPAKVWRIGVLSPDQADMPGGKFLLRMFSQALQRYGHSEGPRLRIEWRWSDGRIWTLKDLAEDLVRQNVDLIVARTNGPIIAAWMRRGPSRL
jgi:putative ABC transport system substrate-binding protein